MPRSAPAALVGEAWRIADELGFAKTDDAEYLALAGSWSRSTGACGAGRIAPGW